MRFEWDGSKSASNLKKHRVSFDEGVTVFYDPLTVSGRVAEKSLRNGRQYLVVESTTAVEDGREVSRERNVLVLAPRRAD